MTNVNKIMKILKKININLSENAIISLIKDGIIMDEAPIEHYIIVKNINEALNNKKNAKNILKQNLSTKTFDRLYKIYKEEFEWIL